MSDSGMTAQLAPPITIAKPDAATAVRLLAAIVKLILEPAMIGAIGTAAESVDGAMIAKPQRQCRRPLPIRRNDG